MKPYKIQAHIHSLNGEMDEITIIDKVSFEKDITGRTIVQFSPLQLPVRYLSNLAFDIAYFSVSRKTLSIDTSKS